MGSHGAHHIRIQSGRIQIHSHRSDYITGTDNVTAYIFGCTAHSGMAGNAYHGSFARNIGGAAVSGNTCNGSYIYDGAAALFQHETACFAHAVHGSLGVDIHKVVHIFVFDTINGEKSFLQNTCIIYNNVQFSVGFNRLINHFLYIFRIGNIGSYRKDVAACLAYFRGNLFQLSLSSCSDHYLCAFFGKKQCTCFPDSGISSGDDGYLVFKPVHV